MRGIARGGSGLSGTVIAMRVTVASVARRDPGIERRHRRAGQQQARPQLPEHQDGNHGLQFGAPHSHGRKAKPRPESIATVRATDLFRRAKARHFKVLALAPMDLRQLSRAKLADTRAQLWGSAKPSAACLDRRRNYRRDLRTTLGAVQS